MRSRTKPPRLVVPLYVHPGVDGEAWLTVIANAPLIRRVVVNVADGPGEAADPAFATVLGHLHRAGVPTAGYIDTGFGSVPGERVWRAARHWFAWYGVGAVFLDQVPTGAVQVPHYRQLVAGLRCCTGHITFNHGAEPDSDYLPLADELVTFEGAWPDYRNYVPARRLRRSPRKPLCHLVYDVPMESTGAAVARARRGGAGAMFATERNGTNPWRGLSPELVAAVADRGRWAC